MVPEPAQDHDAAALEDHLRSRAVIEQAKGMLMATHQCNADEAFDLLRRASQARNVKVHVLATKLTEQAESGVNLA